MGFCKCKTFTNDTDFKTGGWLAEFYLGLSRIIVDIMIHVDEHIESNALGVQHIKMVICCLSPLILRLMSKESIDVKIIANYVKLFLSVCHYFEREIGLPTNNIGNRMTPFWYNRGNFVSLLNLPTQIQSYGPLRLHWEGMREWFIQTLKQVLLNNCNRVSYLTGKLKRIHTLLSFETISYGIADDSYIHTYKRYEDHCLYKDVFEIDDAIQNQRVLSGIILRTDLLSIHILVSNRTCIDAYKLNMYNNGIVFRLNLPFWNISIDTKITYIFNDHRQTLSLIHKSIMIIPLSVSTESK